MKRCTHCKEWLEDSAFRTHKTHGYEGKESWCKECKRRLSRFKYGTQTRLDVLTELVIELDKEWKEWLYL